MTLAQFEAFTAVAARGSFTLAAIQLGISQSGVSHAVGALEKEWGVVLLRRTGGHVELTDIGSRLLLHAQAVLGLTETMNQEASDARGLKQGTLRVGSFGPTSSIHLLPIILAKFRSAFPGIAVHIDEGPDREVLQWLRDRRIDLGFVVLPDERFDTVPLMEDQMVVLLPLKHHLAKKSAVTLQDVCSQPFALTEAGSAEIVTRMFLAAGLQPDIRYRTSQLLSTLDIVARGDGITIVAESSLPKTGDSHYCVKKLNPPVKRSVGMAVIDERQLSPATKAFIQIARSCKFKV